METCFESRLYSVQCAFLNLLIKLQKKILPQMFPFVMYRRYALQILERGETIIVGLNSGNQVPIHDAIWYIQKKGNSGDAPLLKKVFEGHAQIWLKSNSAGKERSIYGQKVFIRYDQLGYLEENTQTYAVRALLALLPGPEAEQFCWDVLKQSNMFAINGSTFSALEGFLDKNGAKARMPWI